MDTVNSALVQPVCASYDARGIYMPVFTSTQTTIQMMLRMTTIT
jgi:hypothetical protein